MKCTQLFLSPFSALYGIIVGIRNFLFSCEILRSRSFSVPVICIGNITAGGTGKTPHTELLIDALRKKFRVACLSRGYKRKTSGFVLAGPASTVRDIGDEPMQIKNKFPDILVACDSKRVRGIERLLALQRPPEVIILDDAFQHRYVQADKNLLLMDYNRPVYEDCLLPAGRLRESAGALKRADYIIVTKCPGRLQPIERRILSKCLNIKPHQQLFFTTLRYGAARTLAGEPSPLIPGRDSHLLCVTGIAQPEPYAEHLKTLASQVTELRFSDHHRFTSRDIQRIRKLFGAIPAAEKYIFTTEKDAVRLRACALPEELREKIYYIPIVPSFLQDENVFFNEILEYVRKNQK